MLKVLGTFGGVDDYESADANERCAKRKAKTKRKSFVKISQEQFQCYVL